jgi:hypothetical protein
MWPPLNHYLVQHPNAANGLLIVRSGLVDLLAVFVLAEWLFGRSVRPLLGLVTVLGLRQVAQGLCALPQPDYVIWHYPGFPSLLVTYSVANDYLFSAHTAIAVFELARLGRRWLKLLSYSRRRLFWCCGLTYNGRVHRNHCGPVCRSPFRTDFAGVGPEARAIPGT